MTRLAAIQAARATIASVAAVTPVFPSRALSEMTGATVAVKAENLQRTGSFKIRGAYTALSAMTADERSRGVVVASAGNHAQGVALAARLLAVPAFVHMPIDAALGKVEATRRYGAYVELGGETFDDAQAAARKRAETTGAQFISAFDHGAIIAGQGTLGLELLEQVPDVDTVVVPVGGGGLISGIAIAVKSSRPDVEIVGVQAAGCSSYQASLAAGRIEAAPSATTIADGIAVKRPGDLTYPIVQQWVDRVVDVQDEAITLAMAMLLERHKLVVEGAGAAGVAALIAGLVPGLDGRRVVVVLSGGNVDLPVLHAVIRRGLTVSRRYLVLRTRIPDRPGSLLRLLEVLAGQRANIVDVVHHRARQDVGVSATGVEVTVETRGLDHSKEVLAELERGGYDVEELS